MSSMKHFMTTSAATSLASHLYLKDKNSSDKPKGCCLHKERRKSSPGDYTTIYVAADTKMGMQNSKTPSNMTLKQYSKSCRSTASRYSQVYTKYTVQRIFVEALPDAICNSMRFYWSSNKSSALHDLARHATFLSTLHGETPYLETDNPNT